MKFILSSIFVFAVLLTGYHLAVKKLPARLQDGGGSQAERNVMRAEAYYYARTTPPVVVVGSSIAERLHDLPKDWFKLTFAGGSAHTGLEIILRKAEKPQVVMIETNVLNLDADQRMIESLTAPVVKDVRRKAPELLEQNKPGHVLVRALTPAGGPASAEVAPMDTALFESLVRRRISELSQPLDARRLDQIAGGLNGQVQALRKQGVRVVFFEVPEMPESRDQPLKTSIRDRIRRDFSPPGYAWVPDENAADYRTTDAVHLNAPGAKHYCEVLTRFIDASGASPGSNKAAFVRLPTTIPSTLTDSARD